MTDEKNIRIIPVDNPDSMLQFFSNDDEKKELVRVGSDGTVTVFEEGADKVASKMFWDAIQFDGKSLIAMVADLTEQVETLKVEKAELKASIEEHS